MKTPILYVLIILGLTACQPTGNQAQRDVFYTCSMDPQVIESKPGSCPICKMPLTAVKKDAAQRQSGLMLSDQQIQLANIRTAPLSNHEMGNEIQLTGKLSVDQNRQWTVSSRVMGRIEKLYFKNAGDIIRKGDVVYEIYSEDLNLAIREYQLALNKKNSFKTEKFDMDRIVQSVRNKMKLYGLSESQIEKITAQSEQSNVVKITSSVSGTIATIDLKEGDYVMEGGSVYHLADYSTLWAEAQVFIDDLPKIKEGMRVGLSFPGLVEKKSSGLISFVNPELGAGSQINLVRVEVNNADGLLKVGMQVDFSVLLHTFKALAVPTDAVLIDEHGATVWKKVGKNHFESVAVQTGVETSSYTQITAGLNNGDTVVISGAYLMNSEYTFKKGFSPMEESDAAKM